MGKKTEKHSCCDAVSRICLKGKPHKVIPQRYFERTYYFKALASVRELLSISSAAPRVPFCPREGTRTERIGQLEGVWRNRHHHPKTRTGALVQHPLHRLRQLYDTKVPLKQRRGRGCGGGVWGIHRLVEDGYRHRRLFKERRLQGIALCQTVKRNIRGRKMLQPMAMDLKGRPQLGPKMLRGTAQGRSVCGGPQLATPDHPTGGW